jgi:hypothetical protein
MSDNNNNTNNNSISSPINQQSQTTTLPNEFILHDIKQAYNNNNSTKRQYLFQFILIIIMMLLLYIMTWIPQVIERTKQYRNEYLDSYRHYCDPVIPSIYIPAGMNWDEARRVVGWALTAGDSAKAMIILPHPNSLDSIGKRFWREMLSINNLIVVSHNEPASPIVSSFISWVNVIDQHLSMFSHTTTVLMINGLELFQWLKKHRTWYEIQIKPFSSCEPIPIRFIHHDYDLVKTTTNKHHGILIGFLLPGSHLFGVKERTQVYDQFRSILLSNTMSSPPSSSLSSNFYANCYNNLDHPYLSTEMSYFSPCKPSIKLGVNDVAPRIWRGEPGSCNLKHIRRSRSFPPSRPIHDEETICFAVPFRNSYRSGGGAFDRSSFVQKTVPGIRSTTSQATRIRFYIGYEESDPLFKIPFLRHVFSEALLQTIQAGDDFILVQFPHAQQDLVYIWNSLFLLAYDDGCQWLQHITDDVDFVNTPGVGMEWDVKFKHLLEFGTRYKYVGSIGRNLTGLATDVNTMPMVHRTHFEIMQGLFYSSLGTRNVFSDTSLFLLYRDLGLLAGPQDLEYWINLSNDNNTRRYSDCSPYYDDSVLFGGWNDFSPQHIVKYLIETRNITFPSQQKLGIPTSREISPQQRIRDVQLIYFIHLLFDVSSGILIGLFIVFDFVAIVFIVVILNDSEHVWMMMMMMVD